MEKITNFRYFMNKVNIHKKYILSGLLSISIFFLYRNHNMIISRFSLHLNTLLLKRKIANRPYKIILIRHGESYANIDTNTSYPNNKIKLTKKGHLQAKNAGEELKKLLKPTDKIKFIISPYTRTRQTYEGMSLPFEDSQFSVTSDPRLREQELGILGVFTKSENYKIQKIKKQRGIFYHRFMNGESCGDVYDRVSSFLESFYREIDDFRKEKHPDVYVLVTHKIFIRVFMMRYFKLSIEEFNNLDKVEINYCDMWIMKKDDNSGKYKFEVDLKEFFKNEDNLKHTRES